MYFAACATSPHCRADYARTTSFYKHSTVNHKKSWNNSILFMVEVYLCFPGVFEAKGAECLNTSFGKLWRAISLPAAPFWNKCGYSLELQFLFA